MGIKAWATGTAHMTDQEKHQMWVRGAARIMMEVKKNGFENPEELGNGIPDLLQTVTRLQMNDDIYEARPRGEGETGCAGCHFFEEGDGVAECPFLHEQKHQDFELMKCPDGQVFKQLDPLYADFKESIEISNALEKGDKDDN